MLAWLHSAEIALDRTVRRSYPVRQPPQQPRQRAPQGISDPGHAAVGGLLVGPRPHRPSLIATVATVLSPIVFVSMSIVESRGQGGRVVVKPHRHEPLLGVPRHNPVALNHVIDVAHALVAVGVACHEGVGQVPPAGARGPRTCPHSIHPVCTLDNRVPPLLRRLLGSRDGKGLEHVARPCLVSDPAAPASERGGEAALDLVGSPH